MKTFSSGYRFAGSSSNQFSTTMSLAGVLPTMDRTIKNRRSSDATAYCGEKGQLKEFQASVDVTCVGSVCGLEGTYSFNRRD